MIGIDKIKNIILEFKLPEDTIKRRYDISVESKFITSLYGARRVGKTYILYQIINDLIVKRSVKKENIIYVNFEDERLANLSSEELHLIVDAHKELYPENTDKVYLFFDEIQNINDWQKFIRRLYDQSKYGIYITGSSAKLLSKELHTNLRGRTLTYKIHPFSFIEYLDYKKVKLERNFQYSEQRFLIKKYFDEYREIGGISDIYESSNQEKRAYLQEYQKLVMFRDVIERHEIKNMELIESLFRFLIRETGTFLSFNKLFKSMKSNGVASTLETVRDYYTYSKEACFFNDIKIYSKSLSKQNSNPKKVFVLDHSLKVANTIDLNPELGKIFETIIFNELSRRGYEISYFKERYEVDFVISEMDSAPLPVQVCYKFDSEETLERETRGIVEFFSVHNRINNKIGYLITDSHKQVLHKDGVEIRIIPAWEFCLLGIEKFKG